MLFYKFVNAVTIIKTGERVMPVKGVILPFGIFKLTLSFPSYKLYNQADNEVAQVEEREAQHKLFGVIVLQNPLTEGKPEQQYKQYERNAGENTAVPQAEYENAEARYKAYPQRAEPVWYAAYNKEKQKSQRL